MMRETLFQEELERKLQEAEEAAEQERRRQRMPTFQPLYVSCPDGLSVRYQLDPTTGGEWLMLGCTAWTIY